MYSNNPQEQTTVKMNLQLSDYANFDVNSIVFSKPEIGSIPGSKLSFKRIRIGTNYSDGTTGDLLLKTPDNLMSFGLQENTDMTTGAVSGYQFPICLWNRNGATPEEKLFTDRITEIAEHCKNYLIAHRDEIEKYDLELTDLKKFNPLYWKMEKGKIVEGRGPMLYIKVMSSKKTGQILTGMIDDDTNTYLDPMDLLNKRCYITGAIKFESIFVGNKISLQLKLFEAVVKVVDTSSTRLLLRADVKPRTQIPDSIVSDIATQEGTTAATGQDDYIIEEEVFEEEEDDDEEEETTTAPIATPPSIPVDTSEAPTIVQTEATLFVEKKGGRKPSTSSRSRKTAQA